MTLPTFDVRSTTIHAFFLEREPGLYVAENCADDSTEDFREARRFVTAEQADRFLQSDAMRGRSGVVVEIDYEERLEVRRDIVIRG